MVTETKPAKDDPKTADQPTVPNCANCERVQAQWLSETKLLRDTIAALQKASDNSKAARQIEVQGHWSARHNLEAKIEHLEKVANDKMAALENKLQTVIENSVPRTEHAALRRERDQLLCLVAELKRTVEAWQVAAQRPEPQNRPE